MRVIRFALVAGVVALGGCQTARERAQQQARNEAAADDAACRSYGLQFGTPAYAECRQRREIASQQQALAMLGVLRGMNQPQPDAAPYMMPTRSPVITNCVAAGTTTQCTSR